MLGHWADAGRAVPAFPTILLAQVVGGIGYTLVEGALEAWLSDEIGEDRVGPALVRGGQIGRATGLLGIGGSVALASLGLRWPLLAAGGLFVVLALILAPTRREPAYRRPARLGAEGWRNRIVVPLGEMVGTARTGAAVVRRRPLGLTILAVAAVFGGFSEGFDRLWHAHFLTSIGLPRLDRLEPVVWFGVIDAGALVLGITAAEGLRRRVDTARPGAAVRALVGLEAVLMASVVAFALVDRFALAVAAFWVASVTRSLVAPVYTAWINRGADPRLRATVLSMSGQADALGQFTVGPALGGLGSLFDLRTR